MAQVKPKRHGPAMDMTAMCDVAFLLLTFFIMTTTFKSQETVKVITPSSVSDLIVEEKNIGTISVTNEGKYFFGITEPVERRAFINVLNTKMNLGLSTDEQNTFTKIAEVGVGKEGLKSYLNLNASDREKVKVPGIACDSVNTELVDWVKAYAESNPAGNLAIRGDVKTQYPAVKILFDELGKAKIYKFRLVTKGE
jgi:biopolymer transport protein ExbD